MGETETRGRKFGFETLQVHAGQEPDAATGSRAVPIYQTTSFVFKDATHAASVFALKEPGNIYTRIMNPTTEVFEKRVAALEGGIGALAVSSGTAAVTYAILNIAETGDNIVAANTLYGGTHTLFTTTLPKLGITSALVDPDDLEGIRRAVNSRTKAIYIETIGNPTINVADIEAVALIAHDNGIPLIIDNTFATPYLCKPADFGADVIIHSATKFLGGHGTSIGGIIVDAGRFDWQKSGKFPGLTEPDPGYHGLKYTETYGPAAYIAKARLQLLRDTGACISPFNSFLFIQGIETLSLRVEKHVQNAQRVAEFLHEHPNVSWVNYPGLPSDKQYTRARKYLPKGAGSIMTFGVKGGLEAGRRFIQNLKVFSLLANVADAKSLVIHPASTTHGQMSEEDLITSGVLPDMVRLSIGIEAADDLVWDLGQALDSVAGGVSPGVTPGQLRKASEGDPNAD